MRSRGAHFAGTRRARLAPGLGGACALVALAGMAGGLLFPAAAVQAAEANSNVSVTIVAPAGIIEGPSNIDVGLGDVVQANPNEDTNQSLDNALSEPAAESPALDVGAGGLPGGFAVAGEAGQVFSLTIPETVVLNINGELVELQNFSHDAGPTPQANSRGLMEIAFTATVSRDQASILQNLTPASGTTPSADQLVILEVASPTVIPAAGAITAEGQSLNVFAAAAAAEDGGAPVPAVPVGQVTATPLGDQTAASGDAGGPTTPSTTTEGATGTTEAATTEGTDQPAEGSETSAENAGGQPVIPAMRIAVRVTDPFGLPSPSDRQVVIVISFN